jgi:hypothetical protein
MIIEANELSASMLQPNVFSYSASLLAILVEEVALKSMWRRFLKRLR